MNSSSSAAVIETASDGMTSSTLLRSGASVYVNVNKVCSIDGFAVSMVAKLGEAGNRTPA